MRYLELSKTPDIKDPYEIVNYSTMKEASVYDDLMEEYESKIQELKHYLNENRSSNTNSI